MTIFLRFIAFNPLQSVSDAQDDRVEFWLYGNTVFHALTIFCSRQASSFAHGLLYIVGCAWNIMRHHDQLPTLIDVEHIFNANA